ncbi:hypothetical protein D3C76_1060360 [compost metagenome]
MRAKFGSSSITRMHRVSNGALSRSSAKRAIGVSTSAISGAGAAFGATGAGAVAVGVKVIGAVGVSPGST